MTSVGMVLMVSALYGSYGWAGGLSAANALAWAVGNAALTRLVDRFGQARVMVPATLVSVAGMGALLAAAWLRAPVWALFPPAVVAGFTGSACAMVLARWTHLLGETPRLHTAFSWESTLNEITYIVGPVVVTFLATALHPVAGLAAPAVLTLIGGVWLFGGLRATQPPIGDAPPGDPTPSGDATPPQDARPTAAERFNPWTLAPVVGVTAMFGLAFGSVDIAAVAAATEFGSRGLAGLALAAMSASSAITGLWYGARHWTSPLPRRFVIGAGAYAASAVSLLLAHNIVMLIVCGFIAGLAVAPSLTNANSLVRELMPPNRLTEGLGWIGTSIGLGAALGAALAGRLIDDFGYIGGYVATITAAMVVFLIAVVAWRKLD